MKRLNKVLIIIALLLGSVSLVEAQSKGKFAHINSNDLLLAMPERAEAEKALQLYAKELEAQLAEMSNEYQTKVTEYQTKEKTWTPLVKQTKGEEITDLEQRIQTFRGTAQQSLQEKELELTEPMVKKAKEAITEVANKNGYTYVFDTSTGAVLHFPEGDDIMKMVKTQMGITQ